MADAATPQPEQQWALFSAAMQFHEWLRTLQATTDIVRSNATPDGKVYNVDPSLSEAWLASVGAVMKLLVHGDNRVMPILLEGLSTRQSFAKILSSLMTNLLSPR